MVYFKIALYNHWTWWFCHERPLHWTTTYRCICKCICCVVPLQRTSSCMQWYLSWETIAINIQLCSGTFCQRPLQWVFEVIMVHVRYHCRKHLGYFGHSMRYHCEEHISMQLHLSWATITAVKEYLPIRDYMCQTLDATFSVSEPLLKDHLY